MVREELINAIAAHERNYPGEKVKYAYMSRKNLLAFVEDTGQSPQEALSIVDTHRAVFFRGVLIFPTPAARDNLVVSATQLTNAQVKETFEVEVADVEP